MLSFDAESVSRVTQSGYEAAAKQADNFNALKEKIFAGGEGSVVRDGNIKRAINIVKEKVLISKIELLGVDSNLERWMRRQCTVKVGEQASKSDIDKSVSIYYGTGNYDNIT